MYLIPQPKNIEFGEPGSHFTLSYGSYVVLEPSCGVGNFFINREDLLRRDFSRILYNWDCS